MRKMEEGMCEAIRNRVRYGSSNTTVLPKDGHVAVYLHDNLIAEVYDIGIVRVKLAGCNTSTTRSRINAVMQCFGGSGISVVKGVPKYEGEPLGLHDWAVYYGKDKEA
jgi:hypothetical protein